MREIVEPILAWYGDHAFEVVDIDNYRIDQVLVTRIGGEGRTA